MKRFSLVKQIDLKDCGPACVGMILKHYHGNISLGKLQELCKTTKNGTTAFDLVNALRKLGFLSEGFSIDLQNMNNIKLPCIAHITVNKSYQHFIVIYKINFDKKYLIIADPIDRVKKISFSEFEKMFNNIIITAKPLRPLIFSNKNDYLYKLIKFFLLKNKLTLLLILLSSTFYTLLTILISFNINYFLDGFNENKTPIYFIYLFIIFTFLILLKSSINFIKNKVLIKLNQKLDQFLTNDIIETIIHLPYRYYSNHTTSEVITRVKDLDKVKSFINDFILSVFIDIPLIIGIMLCLFYLNITLTLCTFILILLYLLLIIIFKPKYENYIKKLHIKNVKVNTFLFEHFKAYETIKGLNIETATFNKFKNLYNSYLKTNYEFEKKYNLEFLFKDLLYSIGPLLILFVGSFYVIQNEISFGKLIAINVLVSSCLFSIKNFTDLYIDYKEAKEAIYRIDNLLIKEKVLKIKHQIKGDILINNLSYKNLLYNVSFHIKNGEKVMLLGKTGSGKTTLCHLLKKYYKVNNNMILIDNLDINKYSNLKDNITYVSQNEKLFTTTLFENLTLNQVCTNDKLDNIIKMCEIDKFMDPKLGLDMLIEEDGFNLSGGQQQQIVLARSLLRENKIMIIDEAMNQMDINLEKRILKRIIKTYKDKTIIIVTHRLTNQSLFNKIINLEDFVKRREAI